MTVEIKAFKNPCMGKRGLYLKDKSKTVVYRGLPAFCVVIPVKPVYKSLQPFLVLGISRWAL